MHIAIAARWPGDSPAIDKIIAKMGHKVSHFDNTEGLVAAVKEHSVDMVLVHWHRRTTDAQRIIQQLRTGNNEVPPVLAVADRSSKKDATEALHAGADDSVVLPSDERTVMTRIGAWLQMHQPAPANGQMVRHGPFRFDRKTKTVWHGNDEIILTAKEFELADLLFSHQDRALSRKFIMETIWHKHPQVETRTLDMHVSRVRSKLGLGPALGFQISTVFGYGYRMVTTPATAVTAKAS